MTCWTFTIDWMGRPHLANAERNVHHHQSAKIRKAWREAGIQGCRMAKVPKGLDRIGIMFQPIYPKGPLPDPDAIHPTAKGAEAVYEFELSAAEKDAFAKSVAANVELMGIAKGFL